MPAAKQTDNVGQNFHDFDPTDAVQVDATRKYKAAGPGVTAFIHPSDPALPGGSTSVFIQWADGNVESRSVVYSDFGDLYERLRALVAARKEDEDRIVVQIRKRLKEISDAKEAVGEDKGKESREERDLRAKLARIESGQIYAFQHLKRGYWPDEGIFSLGQLGKGFYMPDTVCLFPFKDEDEINRYNNGINITEEMRAAGAIKVEPKEVRQFDSTKRRYWPKWAIVG